MEGEGEEGDMEGADMGGGGEVEAAMVEAEDLEVTGWEEWELICSRLISERNR